MDEMGNEVVAPQEPAPAAGDAGSDPFSLDETRFASLSPEQRASLDPVLNDWKTRAKAEIEKHGKTYEEKYRPDLEKARALTELVQKPEFQQWWSSQQQAALRVNPQGQNAIAQTQPQDIASAEEWQSALSDAYSGDPTKMKSLQARMFSVMATPVVQQLRAGQEELRTTMEMKNLFESHADAKDLDKIGYDANDPETPSLLETALNLADEKGKSLEWGYQLAKKWSNSMSVQAKQEAMGLVQGKKESITSGPSTNRSTGAAIVEVNDIDEMMQRASEHALDHPGQPAPKFVIRPPSQTASAQRWAQRT